MVQQYHQKTCIRFRPWQQGDKNWIEIAYRYSGCSAVVGMQRYGGQLVNLAPDCIYDVTITHELMHAVGFNHQHTAYNRDDYIIIHWENIDEKQKYNFDKEKPEDNQDGPYGFDFESAMMYGRYAFSKNKQPVIDAKVSFNSRKIQVARKFSFLLCSLRMCSPKNCTEITMDSIIKTCRKFGYATRMYADATQIRVIRAIWETIPPNQRKIRQCSMTFLANFRLKFQLNFPCEMSRFQFTFHIRCIMQNETRGKIRLINRFIINMEILRKWVGFQKIVVFQATFGRICSRVSFTKLA